MSSTEPLSSMSTDSAPLPVGGPPPSQASGDAPNEQTGAADNSAAELDPQLIQQTKQQIRVLVEEISELVQSDCNLPDFYDGFLHRVVSALASVGGAIWTRDERGGLELQYQINLTKTGLTENEEHQARHALMLKKILAGGEPILVPPQSGSADPDEAGNATDYLLVVAPIKVEQDVHGIVEIFQRPGGGPATQRGYLRFLMQMCELAGDYFKNRQLRHYSDRQSLWENLEQFIHAVHHGLDPRNTFYTIANEGRRLIGCDRFTVAKVKGKRCTIEAVSGLDNINRRSEEVKRLAKLAQAVVAADEPLWYLGDSDGLPPQIEDVLHEYLDKSHAKMLAVLPMVRPQVKTAEGEKTKREAIGALIVEQLRDGRLADGFPKRVEVVASHSAAALSNAMEHHSLFLMPLWKALGKASWILQGKTLPKTILVAAMVIAIFMGLCIAPADFELASQGTLQPKLRREVFAGIDGMLIDVPVEHLQQVEAGQPLARLRNTDLQYEITTLIGRQTTTREQMVAVQRALLNNSRMSPDEQNRLAGELAQLTETVDNLQRQMTLYREKEKLLEVKSPLDGQVVTWQVRDMLLHRPVQRGQSLMTVVNPQGQWELELNVPESRMGHIARADSQAKEGLQVTFMLATHPGKEFTGRVVEIDRAADVRDEEGSTVLLRVAIDKSKLPDLRVGAQVTARIHCGRRAIGYVWFHDLIETVQSKILFWL